MPSIPRDTASIMVAMVATEKIIVLETTAELPRTLEAVKIGSSASQGPKTKIINTTQTVILFLPSV